MRTLSALSYLGDPDQSASKSEGLGSQSKVRAEYLTPGWRADRYGSYAWESHLNSDAKLMCATLAETTP